MFIKLYVQLTDTFGKVIGEPHFAYIDTTKIRTVIDAKQLEFENGCFLKLDDADSYYNETFTADALVELIIEARLHPAQCLPNVGKVKDESRVGERLHLGNVKKEA